jgi:hypothetical protein
VRLQGLYLPPGERRRIFQWRENAAGAGPVPFPAA